MLLLCLLTFSGSPDECYYLLVIFSSASIKNIVQTNDLLFVRLHSSSIEILLGIYTCKSST